MEQVEALRAEIAAWREETEHARVTYEKALLTQQALAEARIRQFRFRTQLAAVVCLLLLAVGSLLAWNVVEVHRQNDRLAQLVADSDTRWCPILDILTRVDPKAPVRTPAGEIIRQRLVGLMTAFGCPGAETSSTTASGGTTSGPIPRKDAP